MQVILLLYYRSDLALRCSRLWSLGGIVQATTARGSLPAAASCCKSSAGYTIRLAVGSTNAIFLVVKPCHRRAFHLHGDAITLCYSGGSACLPQVRRCLSGHSPVDTASCCRLSGCQPYALSHDCRLVGFSLCADGPASPIGSQLGTEASHLRCGGQSGGITNAVILTPKVLSLQLSSRSMLYWLLAFSCRLIKSALLPAYSCVLLAPGTPS